MWWHDLLGLLKQVFIYGIPAIVIEEFLKMIIGPRIKFKIRYSFNNIIKKLSDPSIPVEYVRKSNYFDQFLKADELRFNFINALSNANVKASIEAGDIKIEEFKRRGVSVNGYIRFAYDSFQEELISGLEIIIFSKCHYNEFPEDIFGISKCIDSIEQIIRPYLPINVKYSDILACNLTKIYQITGVLDNLNMKYLQFDGEINMELEKDRVILYDLGPKSLSLLKTLVTLYY